MQKFPVKALLVFATYSDGDLAKFANQVIQKLTGNAYFPNAQQVALSLVPALADYIKKLSVCGSGDRESIAAKQKAKEALINILRSGCKEVNYAGDSDKEILLSSGYPITGDAKKKADAPAAVHDLKAA